MKALATSSGGATAIEYTLIASLLSVMIFAGMTAIGTNLSSFFTTLATSFK